VGLSVFGEKLNNKHLARQSFKLDLIEGWCEPAGEVGILSGTAGA
jgi:hypothetical protein